MFSVLNLYVFSVVVMACFVMCVFLRFFVFIVSFMFGSDVFFAVVVCCVCVMFFRLFVALQRPNRALLERLQLLACPQ